jgi:thioredoxin reductase
MIQASYDVIIIGGSYAGLSAAMALGRSLRNVLVIDSGKPCNAPTPHSHNFLTHDGNTPSEIAATARRQVELYKTVTFLDGIAIATKQQNNLLEVIIRSGQSFTCKKLILATGIKDQLPDIEGLAACWGKTVIHCPYCHGYEYHGQRTAILANGETAMHYALLVSNLSKDLTILTNGKSDLSDEQRNKLNAHRIAVIETPVIQILHEAGNVREVVFNDSTRLSFTAIYFRPDFTQSEIPLTLGCELTEQGYIKIDSMQKTSVSNVFACGDNSSMMRAVANVVAAGNMTGAVVNRELAAEQF